MAAVLLLAFGLRIHLVTRGGAYFWTDEKRYHDAREAVAEMSEGDWDGAAYFLLSKSDHLGFRWLALIPAWVERTIYGDEPPHARIAAGFFALFSVANLYLLWLIARRTGAREAEAFLVVAFAASSNALFYFSRHCFPYDAALTCFLIAVHVGSRPAQRNASFRAGLWCGIGYLVYNGYWSVGAVVLTLHLWSHRRPMADTSRAACLASVGVLLPVLIAFGAARAAGYHLLSDSVRFAGTVNQGDFGDGPRVIGEYLYASDGVLPIGLATLVVAAALRSHAGFAGMTWAVASLLLAAIWIGFSDVVHQFVVYGRTVRALVPFLCLAAGAAAGTLWRSSNHAARRALLCGCAALCLAGWMKMLDPIRQLFPAEFRERAAAVSATVHRRQPDAALQLLFADYLYGPDFPGEPPPHHELLRATHPQRYAPYLYEGYTRAQRPLYLGHDTAMRLIQLDAPPPAPPHYPGAVELRVRFPRDAIGRAEPLVSTGHAGAGDLLRVRYLDPHHVSFELDHWGAPPVTSEAITLSASPEHRLVVSLGALFPPGDDAFYLTTPDARVLQHWLYVQLDDRVAFSQPFSFHDAAPDTVTFGKNPLGFTSVAPGFTGEFLAITPRAPRELGLGAQALTWPPVTGARLAGGYLGTVELDFEVPPKWDPGVEPLLATGALPRGDIVFVKFHGSHRLQVGYRHGANPTVFSRTTASAPSRHHTLRLALASLHPPGGNAPPTQIVLDGELALATPTAAYAAPPDGVTLGFNPVDIKGYRREFSGRLIAIRLLNPPGG